MKLPHAHVLYVHGTSVVHRAAPPVKLVGLVVFAVTAAATPRHWIALLAVEALVLVGAAGIARLRPRLIVARLAVEAPFVAFAVFLPFLGGGERIDVGGLALSVDGSWAAWGILAKGTLCLTAAVIVTATTTVPDILTGLARLHAPGIVVSIAGFMVRYLDVVAGEWRRMRCAMAARGFAPRTLADARPLANGAGALFVRAHERGERVYGAMLARGFAEAGR